MNKLTFLAWLIDILHIISPAGRERIYQDMFTEDCDMYYEGKFVSVELVDISCIENLICEKFTNSYFIDLGINWGITTKDNLVESELQRAANVLTNYLSFLAKGEKNASFVKILTQILLKNKSLLIM